MRALVQVHVQHRSLAEHRVAHALPDGQRAVAVVLAQILVSPRDVIRRFTQKRLVDLVRERQKLAVDIQQKARGIARRAVKIPPVGLGEVKPLLRARQRNESEPPLLLHAGERSHLARGENALVHAAEEHIREFEALRRVDGHQLHLVALLGDIAVAEKRDVGEVMLHRALLAAARLVFVDGLLELGQIVQPLLTALGAQRLFIPALVQNIREHLRDGPPLIRVRKALDQIDKLLCLRAAEHAVFEVVFERYIEARPLFFRRLL